MNYAREWIDLDVQIMHKTEAAALVSDGDTEVWIPKSSIGNWDDDWGAGDSVSIDVSVELAEEKGLV